VLGIGDGGVGLAWGEATAIILLTTAAATTKPH